jgi:hypothetical protein
MANAEKFAKSASSKDVMQQYEGYKDFADNLTRDPDTPKELGTQLRMLQNIRTQSDQLGTLATCKVLPDPFLGMGFDRWRNEKRDE